MNGWEAAVAKFPKMKRVMNRTINSIPNVIMPEVPGHEKVFADNPIFLRYMSELADVLPTILPATIDDEGFAGANGITSDFSKLRTVSGLIMNPVTIPAADNAKLTEQLNLVTNFISPRHAEIFRRVHNTMFATHEPASLSIRKLASTGVPFLTNDLTLKKHLLFDFISNFDHISKLVRAGDYSKLFDSYDILFASVSGLRLQPDKSEKKGDTIKSKERLVNDEEYARTGGVKGKRFPADKRVFKNDRVIDDHFAMRARAVWGASFAPNYFISAFFSCYRAFYLNRYAFTWKHRSATEIKDKMSKYSFIIGVDISQFDQSVTRFLLDYFVKGFIGKLDDRVVELIDILTRMPYIQTDPRVGSKEPKPILVGDPLDASTFVINAGLPSGISPNPDIGKFLCTATYLCLFDDYFNDVLEIGIDSILSGNHPRYGLLNAGDDCVLMTNDAGFRRFVDEFAESERSYYLRVEPENGVSFLGNVFYKDTAGSLQVAPNIESFIVNWLVPENGIDHISRRDFHHIGWTSRKDHFVKAPSYDVVFNTWEEIHRKFFNEALDMRENWFAENTKHDLLRGLTDIDRQVVINPDSLQYKFTSADVSQFVLDRYVGSVPAELYYPHIEHLFK